MAVSLKRGGSFNLTKEIPGLKKIMIGVGWELKPGNPVDLDASVFMLNESNKLPSNRHFVFYNNLKSHDSSVQHTGDNRTGMGEGDDEMILIHLEQISEDVSTLLFIVSIHEAFSRAHNFGHLQDAYIRIFDATTRQEVLRYDLDFEYPNSTEVEIGKLVKEKSDWRFWAVGNGTNTGLQGYVDAFIA